LFQAAIKELILRDSFYAPEVDIFRAVCEWVQANPDEDANDILSVVRLPLMSLSELLGVVRPSGLVSPDTILDAIQARTQSKDSELNYRGCLSEYGELYYSFLFCLYQRFTEGCGIMLMSVSNRICLGTTEIEQWIRENCTFGNDKSRFHRVTISLIMVLTHDLSCLHVLTHATLSLVTSVRFEVFTAVTMKNAVFWDVMPCGSRKSRRFRGT
jgi:hypothetical protein